MSTTEVRGLKNTCALSLVATFMSSGLVFAQQEAIGSSALEEIIVTANKRGAVSLQDTAGSISAITSKSLEIAQVEGFEDYIKLVPGLTSVSSGPGQSQIVIRGVNANRVIHSAAQVRSLVGLYIDDTPISVAGFNPDLGVVDIERIEVLRGPQGTLYGASSVAGTIRVITKQPDVEKVSGNFGANVSSTEDGGSNFRVKGGINVPLSETVAVRVSAYNTSNGGFIDNVAPGFEEEDYNSSDTVGGRAQIGYYGENLDLSATIIYNNLESDGSNDEYVGVIGDARVAAITDELQTVRVLDDFFDQEFTSFNITANYDFGPVILTSATSIFDVEVDRVLDDTFRVSALLPITNPSPLQAVDNYDTTIQEIRLASNYDSPLEWVAGLYYESNEREFVQTQPTPGLNAFFTAIGAPPCNTLDGLCFGAANNSIFDGVETIDTDQIAVFGEATYNFTDSFRVKLGLRYFDYDSDVNIFGSGPANGGVSTDIGTIEEDGFVPKVEVAYDISEDHLVYATYSEGFRIGGVNGFTPEVCAPDLAALGSGPGDPFDSDTITNYEIGAKTAWLENRLVANFAVYRNEFEDIQTNVALDCGFFQDVNAGQIDNVGFEGDFTYQASDALSLRLGFSYVDSEVAEAVPSVNSVGDSVLYVPELSASGTIDYSVPLWNGTGYIRSDFRYVDDSINEFSSVATASTLPSYTIVDLNLGYETESYRFGLFVKNLFDEEIITNIDPDRIQPDQITRGAPRTIGISVSRDF